MSEHPYWPYVRLLTCANGWMVRPDYEVGGRGHTLAPTGPEDAYVFNEWEACQKFLAVVTEPRRTPSAGEKHGS